MDVNKLFDKINSFIDAVWNCFGSDLILLLLIFNTLSLGTRKTLVCICDKLLSDKSNTRNFVNDEISFGI